MFANARHLAPFYPLNEEKIFFMQVVIVDENVHSSQVVSQLVGSWYTVEAVSVSDAEKCLLSCKETCPLVLINISHISTYHSFIDKVRSKFSASEVPIIIYANDEDAIDFESFDKYEINDFFLLNTSPQIVKMKLKNALRLLTTHHQILEEKRYSKILGGQLTEVFNCLPILLMVVNNQGKIIEVNQSVKSIVNLESDDVKGKFIGQIFHCEALIGDQNACWEKNSCNQCIVKQTVNSTFLTKENIYKAKGKVTVVNEGRVEVKTLQISSTYLNGEHEPLLLLSIDDITIQEKNKDIVRKQNEELREVNNIYETQLEELTQLTESLRITTEQLEESHGKLEAFMANSQIAFLTIENYRIIDCNSAAVTLFGLHAKTEVIGKHPGDLSPEMQQSGKRSFDAAQGYMKKAIKNGSCAFEWEHINGKRGEINAEVSLSAAMVEDRQLLFAVIHDITEQKSVEAGIKESESKYRMLFESMNDAFAVHKIITDENGTPIDYVFIEANSKFLRRLGLKKEQLIGKRVRELFPNTELKWLEIFGKVALTAEAVRFIDYSAELDRYYDTNVYSPEYGLFAATFIDVTEKIKIEKSLAESEALLKHAQHIGKMGHWILDVKKNELKWSDEVYRIFELDPDKFEGTYEAFLMIIHPDDRKRVHDKYVQSLKDHLPYEIRHRLLLKDGKLKYVRENCITEFDNEGNPLVSIGTVLDITEQVLAEQKITEQNAELSAANNKLKDTNELLSKVSRQLFESNSELNDNKKMLEKLIETKDQLFSIISHDLRSPFASLIGLTSFLLKEYDKYSTEEKLTFINHIDTGLNNALKLIDDLLLWSQSQKGTIDFKPQTLLLHYIVDEVFEILNQSASNKNIDLKTNVDNTSVVYADRNMVSTILRNLITNAIKFTHRGGAVRVSCTVNSENYATISVVDTGVGISEKKMENLFVIAKNHSTKGTEKEPGTGLGLVLCREFVETNRGEIWVESAEGKGSSFFFTLPQSAD